MLRLRKSSCQRLSRSCAAVGRGDEPLSASRTAACSRLRCCSWCCWWCCVSCGAGVGCDAAARAKSACPPRRIAGVSTCHGGDRIGVRGGDALCRVQIQNSKSFFFFFFFFFFCVCVCENSELVNPSQKNPDDCPKTQCIAPRTRVLDRASAPQRPRAEAGPQRTRRPGGSARQDRPRAWSAPSRPLAAADPQGCGLIKVVRFLGWQYGLVQHHHRDRDTGLVARLSTRGNLENGKKKKHAH
jgi:hypothetical protein